MQPLRLESRAISLSPAEIHRIDHDSNGSKATRLRRRRIGGRALVRRHRRRSAIAGTRRQHTRALTRTDHQEGLAGRREHRDERHDSRGKQSAVQRPVLSPLLRHSRRPARTPVSECRLGRDRRCEERLHHHQCARDRERDRDHRDAAGRSRAQGGDRRQGSRLRCRGIEGTGEKPRGNAARGLR